MKYFVQQNGTHAAQLHVDDAEGGHMVLVTADQAYASAQMLEALYAAQHYIEKNGIFKDGHTYPLIVNAIAKAKGEG